MKESKHEHAELTFVLTIGRGSCQNGCFMCKMHSGTNGDMACLPAGSKIQYGVNDDPSNDVSRSLTPVPHLKIMSILAKCGHLSVVRICTF